jgi:hypothetical protein
MTNSKIDLRTAKAAVREALDPGHPGRELMLSLEDEVEVDTFDLAWPVLVKLLRLRMAAR